MTIGAGFDKGLILQKAGAGITTALQYSPVVNKPANGILTPTNACMQFSGTAARLALWVRIVLDGASNITKVSLSIESAYGNFLDGTGAEVAVDLLTAPWAPVLATVHAGAGTTNVLSDITPLVAGANRLVLVTCDPPAFARNLRVGVKADAAGVSTDSVMIFAAAL